MMRVFSYKRYYLECTCKLNFTEIDSLAAALLRVVVYSTVLYCTWYNVHARLICTHDLQGSTHSNSLHQEKIDENLVFLHFTTGTTHRFLLCSRTALRMNE
jgi:hypothetical protein